MSAEIIIPGMNEKATTSARFSSFSQKKAVAHPGSHCEREPPHRFAWLHVRSCDSVGAGGVRRSRPAPSPRWHPESGRRTLRTRPAHNAGATAVMHPILCLISSGLAAMVLIAEVRVEMFQGGDRKGGYPTFPNPVAYACHPLRSRRQTSSATLRAPIFFMMFARWNRTVVIAIPR